MATSQTSQVIRRLRMAVLLRDGARLTDGQLLEDYISRRDEAALAALVHRHAPMVWGVCRRVLRNYHDAEDAFQAAFLVFVRKAASIASRELLANWLYGVAHQTALKARATAAKRKERERQATKMPEPAATEQDPWHDLQPLLDEELSRLPDKYRAVVVLCDLEGKTRKEVARQLGCPEGTVAGRLSRARRMLAKQLARRGVALSGGALAAVLSRNVASAGAPPSVVSSTIKAASLFAAGQAAAKGVISAKAAALSEGVLKAMLLTKARIAAVVVLVIAALAGAAGLIYQTQAADPPKAKAEPLAAKKDQNVNDEKQANPPAQPEQQPARSDQERMAGGWVIVNEDSGRKGEEWLIGTDEIVMNPNLYGFRLARYFHHLNPDKDPKQIDITVKKTNLEYVGVIKGIYALAADELRLCLGEGGKDRPAAFPAKPKPGEVLILHRYKPDKGAAQGEEKLRTLIDQVLEAHGGEDKLNKLQFTMTVKHNNGTTIKYFIQPPDHLRSEEPQGDDATLVTILFHNSKSELPGVPQNGRAWWIKHPNGEVKIVHFSGAERTMEFQLDRVKFFGPRQVLRLKDADHRVTLLDEEAKIDGRAAVGVEVTGPEFKGKMYFDKETHLLVKLGNTDWPGDSYYSDYKKFDGIPVAQKEKQPGYMETEVTDFRAVDKLDAKLFEQP
jgi:RNA polymerase sigma factor (sigma-70 family)